jgi:hypothetical protein
VANLVSGTSKLAYRKPYLNPLLSLDQLVRSSRQALKLKIARWLRLLRGPQSNATAEYGPKHYEPPQARIISLEQARLLALGSLSLDDEHNPFIQMLFPSSPGTADSAASRKAQPDNSWANRAAG